MAKNITIKEGRTTQTANNVSQIRVTDAGSGSTENWVPEDDVNLGILTINANGTYRASDDGYYGYSKVIVNTPTGTTSKTVVTDSEDHITESKSIRITEGSSVKTFEDIKRLKVKNTNDTLSNWVAEDGVQLTRKTVTEAGTYEAEDDDYYGFSEFVVNIPEPPEPQPAYIKIITRPTKEIYNDGENFNSAGMVVQAFNEDDTVWETVQYPNGIIPLSELRFNKATIDFDEDRLGKYDASLSDIVPLEEQPVRFMAPYLMIQGYDEDQQQWTRQQYIVPTRTDLDNPTRVDGVLAFKPEMDWHEVMFTYDVYRFDRRGRNTYVIEATEEERKKWHHAKAFFAFSNESDVYNWTQLNSDFMRYGEENFYTVQETMNGHPSSYISSSYRSSLTYKGQTVYTYRGPYQFEFTGYKFIFSDTLDDFCKSDSGLGSVTSPARGSFTNDHPKYLAWIALYGDDAARDTLQVSWNRPRDHQTLSVDMDLICLPPASNN